MIVRGLGQAVDEIRSRIVAVAERHGIDPALALAVARVESGFDHGARGSAGEIGVFQVMPIAARDVGIDPDSLRDLDVNIEAGVRYLAKMLTVCGGDAQAAVMAYNAGPRVCTRGEIPPASYVYAAKVMMAYDRELRSMPVVAASGSAAPRTGSGASVAIRRPSQGPVAEIVEPEPVEHWRGEGEESSSALVLVMATAALVLIAAAA